MPANTGGGRAQWISPSVSSPGLSSNWRRFVSPWLVSLSLKKSLSSTANMLKKLPSSASDTLMSNARAAGKKNSPKPGSFSSSSSSYPKKRKALDRKPYPKKRKTLDRKPSINLAPISETKVSIGPPKPEETHVSNRLLNQDKPNPSSGKPEEKQAAKKPPEVNVAEVIAELKKKPASFDPEKAGYWGKGKRVPFLFLVRVFDEIFKEKESGRIVITAICCNMLRTVIYMTPDDLLPIVYLLANRIAPGHEGVELGIGDASLQKGIAEAYGTTEANIKKEYVKAGDLGKVAQACRKSQSLMCKPEPLTAANVFNTFRLIAKESGKDCQAKKNNHIKGLLVAATDCEPLYLIRLLQKELRIGSAEQTLLAALGQAVAYTEKRSSRQAPVDSLLDEAAKIVKQVYSVFPVYDKIVPSLLSDGVWNLPKTCWFSPGVPVGPMLAKPTKGVSEILDKFQDTEFTCEFKYDGERAQIHYMEDGKVEIYSRNAERNTEKYPDVVEIVSRLKKEGVTAFVLDCELVGYDRKEQKITSFQTLSTRSRKHVKLSEIKVDVCIYAFDLLYLNGEPLLQEQLSLRRERLYDSFEEEPGFFQFATAMTSNDPEEIQRFLKNAVNSSCEGLIIKTLNRDATYEPAKRSNNWLKLKKDYMESTGDTLDLVPIAAFHGQGKRVGVYGSFLLACYDSDSGYYQSICKAGTGFSDDVLEGLSTSLRSKVIPKPKSYYEYADTKKPDVWFEATEVWEVKGADFTISPVYHAAFGSLDPNKGISLRFPRFVRVREDKIPEDASTSEMVAEMYNAQKHNQKPIRDVKDNESRFQKRARAKKRI